MAEEDEHQVARYFAHRDALGYLQHYVQCTCGERFKGDDDRDVMSKQFRHAWAKTTGGQSTSRT